MSRNPEMSYFKAGIRPKFVHVISKLVHLGLAELPMKFTVVSMKLKFPELGKRHFLKEDEVIQ